MSSPEVNFFKCLAFMTYIHFIFILDLLYYVYVQFTFIYSLIKNDHHLVLKVKKFGQVFPAFRKLKLRATSLNGQVGKKVNVKR
jgi:hypothetical protein